MDSADEKALVAFFRLLAQWDEAERKNKKARDSGRKAREDVMGPSAGVLFGEDNPEER